MRRYENVRLRSGTGSVEGFLFYVVELPHPVAVLARATPWRPDDKAVARLLSEEFATVASLGPDGPGAALARCTSSESDPVDDVACAVWALKAKGGWGESPIMTFRIAVRSHASAVSSVAWMTARSSDGFRVDVSRTPGGGWDTVRAQLLGAPDPSPLRVVLIDVDWMQSYNDAYGHEEGDLVIARLWSCFEERAGRDGAALVRVAGEEFAVVVNEVAPGSASRLAEALRQDVERLNIPFHHPERATLGHVTVSAGVVAFGDPARLMDEASDAVYDAKRAGRNRIAARIS